MPPQQWALHNRQAQFDGFLQAHRTQYLFDVRKRLKFIHVPVHIRKKRRVIDARIVFHTDDEEVVIRFEMRPKIQVEFSLWIVLGEEALKIVIESDLGDPPTHPQSGQPNEDQGPFGACFPKNRNVISHRKSNKCLRSGFKVKTKKPQTEVRGFS